SAHLQPKRVDLFQNWILRRLKFRDRRFLFRVPAPRQHTNAKKEKEAEMLIHKTSRATLWPNRSLKMRRRSESTSLDSVRRFQRKRLSWIFSSAYFLSLVILPFSFYQAWALVVVGLRLRLVLL